MRLERSSSAARRLGLLCLAAGALQGQVLVTLGDNISSNNVTGGQTVTLTAQVTGSGNTSVTFNFSPSVAGATVGTPTVNNAITTITYKAPAVIGTRQTVTATATSVADPSQSASVQFTLTPPAVSVVVSPGTVTLNAGQNQQFSAQVLGVSQTGVVWSISPQTGSIGSTGFYTAPASISTTQTVTVTATSTFDSTVSGKATVTLAPAAAISVTVQPSSVAMTNSQTQQFTATVANSSNQAVTWSINPATGNITSTGAYTAPALISSTTTLKVTATSVADPTKSGSASVTLSNFITIGSGAPANQVNAFLAAYYRNGFDQLTTLPPVGAVTKLGTTGYVQLFNDAAGNGTHYALVSISPTSQNAAIEGVVQIYPGLYTYYASVGSTTAGYPTEDNQACPPFDVTNNCYYDLFDKGYALFSYAVPLAAGQNFSISGTVYTEWSNLGGISGPGRPLDALTASASPNTASTGTTYLAQPFSSGTIYSIVSGTDKGKVFGVVEPIFDLYTTQGGPSGALGLPVGDLTALSASEYIQKFEGGTLQYSTSGGGPTVRLPVAAVAVSGASNSTVGLNVGQSISLTATVTDTSGAVVTDRVVSWTSNTGGVVSIQANGAMAVVTAVAAGTASVLAVSEGVQSPRLVVVVTAPCCQIGEGAPTAVAAAFQAALARNKMTAPAATPSPAARVGSGYAQMVQPAAQSPYLLADADGAAAAYVVQGAVLAAYQSLGGPGGTLGYPASDQSAGGTQKFQNTAALAGNPVQLVSGPIYTKWAQLGMETGAAGAPAAAATTFSTFGANAGFQQAFANGTIVAATAGPRQGQAYLVSGPILSQFNALGGASGSFGMPTSDQFVASGVNQQNFEGGIISYTAGSAATSQATPRTPGVAVSPSAITAGSAVQAAVFGFANNATLRVSVTGQPTFVVTTANGAYSWNFFIPLTAKSGTTTITAADMGSPATASGTLTVNGLVDNRVPISKVQGDNQTGPPGALLPVPLEVALADAAGNPVVGAAVVFQASQGASVTVANAVTDATGKASTFMRLPPAAGIAAVTANAASIAQAPVTFFARAAAFSLTGFPQSIEAGSVLLGHGPATIGQKGALLTAVASILNYYQSRAALPAPNGTATAGALNQFLLNDCAVDPNGNQLCDGFLSNPASGEQIVNLWRAADFTGGVNVTALVPTAQNIADQVAQGTPLLLSLGLSLNGQPAGGAYVSAIGVNADGSIAIQDPNPFFARSNLNDYLNGFTAGGGAWTATLRGVVQLAPGTPSATRFLVGALSQPGVLIGAMAQNVQSAAGGCGQAVDLWDAVDSAGNAAQGALVSRLTVCDGLAPVYEVTVGTGQPFQAFVTDLAAGGDSTDLSGSSAATYRATRPQLALALAPETASFSVDGVVNAASFTPGIAPNGLMAVFGAGLSGPGSTTTLDFDGIPASVVSTSPFQVNAVVPAGLTSDTHTLTVHSAFGTAQQAVVVSAVEPAIFVMGSANTGVLVNPDGTLNGPSSPLLAGQTLLVYATGLGVVTAQGGYSVVSSPVTVVVNGQELPVAFAGLAPGFPGVYQINVTIPASTPPGLQGALAVKVSGQTSNPVAISLQ